MIGNIRNRLALAAKGDAEAVVDGLRYNASVGLCSDLAEVVLHVLLLVQVHALELPFLVRPLPLLLEIHVCGSTDGACDRRAEVVAPPGLLLLSVAANNHGVSGHAKELTALLLLQVFIDYVLDRDALLIGHLAQKTGL